MTTDQVVTRDFHWGRHHLTPGVELTVQGIRGRVRYVQHVANTDTGAEWIDVVHGKLCGIRAIRLERIRTVHRNRVMP